MSAFFTALPRLLELVMAIIELARAARDRNQAIDSVVAEVLMRATADIRKAAVAEDEADKDHKDHPNDDQGFDNQFRRD